MIFVGVNGALGKMGSLLCQRILLESDISLTEAFENKEHPSLNQDLGISLSMEEWKLNVTKLEIDKNYKMNVLIDFSSKSGFSSALDFCLSKQIPFVSGTTGLEEKQMSALKMASKKISVLYSTNMSAGINSILVSLESMKDILCDQRRDIEIIECHHNQKKDSPSGTSLSIARKIAEISKRKIGTFEKSSFPRGTEIRIHSLRMGSIPGYHKIIISGNGETIEFSHSADSRETFAFGAIKAARFIAKKSKGFYSIIDVLKEK